MRLPVLCAVLIAAASAAVAEPLSLWSVDALVNVFPDDTPPPGRTACQTWLVPRNGHTSLQVALRSNTDIRALHVFVTLDGALGTEVRRVGYVPVRSNVPETPPGELARRAPARFPDPLFEEDTFALPAKETTAVWITVYAPPRTKPGVYKGEALFKADGKRAGKVRFRIRVVSATVPARQTLKVSNWFYFSEPYMAQYFDVQGKPEKLWELLANISRVAAGHKQNVFLTPVLALTDARRKGDGIEYDFSRFDRFVDTVMKAGAMEVIEGGHLLERAGGYNGPLTIPGFALENGEVTRQAFRPDDPRGEAHLNSFLPALYAHLKEKGWLERYIQHVLDEPHGNEPPAYARCAAVARRNLPGVRTMDAFDQESTGWMGDACDIKVLQLGKFDNAMDTVQQHVARGGEAWYYTCLFPRGRYPNRFIDFPLLKTRLLHWLNYRYALTGYLHWGGDSWGPNPFEVTELGLEVGAPTTDALPAGDAFITYPCREKNTVLSSIRLEAMREGIEDYELLHALGSKHPDRAMQLARKAVADFTDYVRDVPSFRKVQAELLAAAE
ncbi:MAG TPA: glycoside hydrolase domain-containing protein [Bryobacteraceae bacterium]